MKTLLRKFGRFALVSALSVAGVFGGTIFLREVVGFAEWLAYAITLMVVFISNFLFLRYYIFPDHKAETDARKQFFVTAASSALFRLIEFLLFLLLVEGLGVVYIVAMVIVQPSTFIIKFFYYRRVVFTPNRLVRRK